MAHNLLYFPEIHSTNAYAMENMHKLEDRQVIVAGKQTEGRGQFDRMWVSNKEDNVYLSIVLKNVPLINLTPYMAEIVSTVIREYGINPQIKPPNDVLVEGKKIAGILAQSVTQGDKLKGMVIGLGVNLNLDTNDLEKIDQPATSLNLLLEKPVNRDLFIEKLLDEFIANLDTYVLAESPEHQVYP